MRFLPAGAAALLVELPDLAHALALYRATRAAAIAGVDELVPAARTLLVQFDPAVLPRDALTAALQELADAGGANARTDAAIETLRIPAHYDGEDLQWVAQHLGISVRELIARHTGMPWQAAFAGFAPGFVYLAGGHPCFRAIPRRPTPRLKVPAGSVALAGNLSAVYPSASPGGWQLIGSTPWALWDMARAHPALIRPGMQVQFVDADAPGVQVSLPASARPRPAPTATGAVLRTGTTLEIVHPGLQTLIQDGGRPHQTELGITRSGALDQTTMRAANRLVGNPEDAAVLENVLGGLQLHARGGPLLLGIRGAQTTLTLTDAHGGSHAVPGVPAVQLPDGATLRLGRATAGVRCIVAVRGGLRVAAVLGSRSTDTLAHIGPPALRAHARIAAGSAIPSRELHAPGKPETSARALPAPGSTVTLDVLLGPRADWFTAAAITLLSTQTWRVTPQCNRVGMRLHGTQPLSRSRHEELPSEGTVAGAIQVPASGQPVLFLADHPLTGGYPVIAVVAPEHLDLAAQIPIGCTLRFRVR